MVVSLYDLVCNWSRLESENFRYFLMHFPSLLSKCCGSSNSSVHHSNADIVFCMKQSVVLPVKLVCPDCEFHSISGWKGMLAMGTADADFCFVLFSQFENDFSEPFYFFLKHFNGVFEKQ